MKIGMYFMVSLFMSWPVLAQTSIDKGESAPEDGVFFTNLEAAELIAERESSKEKLKFELEEQEKRLNVVCQGEKEVKDLKLQIEKEKNIDILSIKDKQIDNLYKQLEKESVDYSLFWFVGGATVATVASVAIFFAATQTDKTPSLLSGN